MRREDLKPFWCKTPDCEGYISVGPSGTFFIGGICRTCGQYYDYESGFGMRGFVPIEPDPDILKLVLDNEKRQRDFEEAFPNAAYLKKRETPCQPC